MTVGPWTRMVSLLDRTASDLMESKDAGIRYKDGTIMRQNRAGFDGE